jgi:hypothetical protein
VTVLVSLGTLLLAIVISAVVGGVLALWLRAKLRG